MENKKKKRYGIIAALLLLVLAAGVGTYAWLTAQSSLTNNFTTAGINHPTTNPDNPDQPIPDDKAKVNGNLTETNWVADSKLAPGVSVPKNPNVGIGKGSENAYVYVFVKNETASAGTADSKTTYFTINKRWKAVEATAVEANRLIISVAFSFMLAMRPRPLRLLPARPRTSGPVSCSAM